ncbi:endonuclease [Rhodosalinus sp. 5P4]|uniref:endonuclease n=1 Tax=Rhodosalinus sp. 5P4 TaxID=3239196 RepID=UPI003525C955
MTGTTQKDIAADLMARHGPSLAGELGLELSQNTPAPLFRLLCAALLLSARISSDLAMRAAAALAEAGWTTPAKLADSTWQERVEVLNGAGYARFDEKTATMLGELAEKLLDDYGGDLRRLRQAAGRDPDEEHRLLREFKGIGNLGADIFCREAQVAWDELYPYADSRTLSEAARRGLPETPEGLGDLVGRARLPGLLAALMRAA